MLKDRLIEQIALEGPMSVADYMARCLFDPIDGYYATRPALGAEGDFITAPIISQMFGEMIGVWVAQTWQALGSPPAFRLVEIGGGDGTLMSDILRVADRVPGLRQAAHVTMVELSQPLQALQAERVPEAQFLAEEDIPDDLPLIVIGNELLDCLPARQYVSDTGRWHERLVGVRDGALCFGLASEASEFLQQQVGQDGDVFEYSPELQRFAVRWFHKLKVTTGAMLLIDYGRDTPGFGDTLQALHRHQKADPLEAPGRDDLTVWANFPLLAGMAHTARAKASPIVSQRDFLSRLGIDARHAALTARNPDQTDILQRQYDRLMSPDQMGTLFKVLGIAFPVDVNLFALEAADSAG